MRGAALSIQGEYYLEPMSNHYGRVCLRTYSFFPYRLTSVLPQALSHTVAYGGASHGRVPTDVLPSNSVHGCFYFEDVLCLEGFSARSPGS